MYISECVYVYLYIYMYTSNTHIYMRSALLCTAIWQFIHTGCVNNACVLFLSNDLIGQIFDQTYVYICDQSADWSNI